MFLLRLAYAHNKVLLVVWTRPEPIDEFIVPNLIDWTLNGLPDDVVEEIHSNRNGPFHLSTTHAGGQAVKLRSLAAGEHVHAFREVKLARMQVNLPYYLRIEGLNDESYLPWGPKQISYGR
jgi:hypothetical protein